MTIEAVIFDRDGVLIDPDLAKAAAYFEPIVPISLQEIFARWLKWGEKVGFPSSPAEEKTFFRRFWRQLGDEFRLPQAKRAQLYRFNYTRYLRPFPEVKPALEEIRRRGLRIGVLSNFSLATIEASLEAIGMLDLVDAAYAAMVIGLAKPEPGAYLKITQALSTQPENCLLFDDKMTHVEGGRAVGIHSYLVDRRRSDHDLAEGIVCDLAIIPTILDQYLDSE
jgi:putative hydrolase of the HAD superfamily